MKVQVPKEVLAFVVILEKAGFEAHIVGGAVRDTFLKRETHDWDFTTNALPEEIQQLFPESFYENTFGTVGVAREHLWNQLLASEIEFTKPDNWVFEITTYRKEGVYRDNRRPEEVTWGKTVEEDLQRRDFTINAIALRLPNWQQHQDVLEKFATQTDIISVEVEVIDPFHGQADLKNRSIVAVGDPNTRFEEDALRMLRAVRFAAQLEFSIDQNTLVALQKNADRIVNISWERIRDEFLKILVTDNVEDALTILYTTGLLQHILPELIATRGIDQRGHHEHDVWTHSLRACQLCASQDPVVRLAALLHDIAKPETQEPLPELSGEYSFYNHEVVGARTARDIARRFKLPKEDVQRIFTLVRWHMFHYQPDMTDSAIRRFIRRVGRENIQDIMALREGDRLGSGSKRTSWRLQEMQERIDAELNQPMHIHEMAVDGQDVMRILDIPPGPRIGEVLNTLFEDVFENPEKNDREYLLKRLEEIKK